MSKSKSRSENNRQKSEKVVAFRLNNSEYDELQKKKEELNMTSISEYLRAMLNEREVKVKKVYTEDPQKIDLIKELIYQIRMIGMNINQIAYGVNLGLSLPQNFFRDAEKMLQKINRNAKKILSEMERDFEIKKRL